LFTIIFSLVTCADQPDSYASVSLYFDWQIAMPTLLFVTYGGGHVNMIIPLLERLRERENFKCVTLALTTAAKKLEQCDLPWRGFSSLLRDDDERAREWGERLVENLPASEQVTREESIAYLGLSYADLEDRVGVEAAAQLYASEGRNAFLPLGPVRRLFDELMPDLVITTISPRAERAAVVVARERNIPSLCLIDLFGTSSLYHAREAGYGTRVCVISEAARQWLIGEGRGEDEVVVTGNPAFDQLGNPELQVRGSQQRQSKGWDDCRVILWASQIEPAHNPITGEVGDPELPMRIEKSLVEIVERRPDWRLVIRPHPNEPARDDLGHEQVVISSREEDLHTLLQAVDVVVIMTSTVGLEARLLGKPLVSVDLSVFSKGTPYKDAGLSLGVHDLNELEATIEVALKQGEKMADGFAQLGRATDAVVGQIDALLMGYV
jgi:hypothetical protein